MDSKPWHGLLQNTAPNASPTMSIKDMLAILLTHPYRRTAIEVPEAASLTPRCKRYGPAIRRTPVQTHSSDESLPAKAKVFSSKHNKEKGQEHRHTVEKGAKDQNEDS